VYVQPAGAREADRRLQVDTLKGEATNSAEPGAGALDSCITGDGTRHAAEHLGEDAAICSTQYIF
jgi:hypothetical protein